MNEQETAPRSVTETPLPAARIPGVARVQSLATPLARTPATLLGETVASLLGWVGRALNPSLIESSLLTARKLGHYAVLAGGALTVVYAIYGAIKYNSFSVFMIGIGCVVGLAVAQFAAIRFLGAADKLVASTPSRISSSAFVECSGLLVLLVALTSLLGGIATSVVARTIAPLLPALVMSITLTCIGAIALHPRVANVEIGEGTAGEEAIGLLSFFFKAGLKLAPLFFALFSIAGAIAVLLSFFGEGGAFANTAQSIIASLPLPVNVPYGLSGSALLVVACLIPMVSYFVFLLQYLFVDVLRAVLAVPAKLDALRH